MRFEYDDQAQLNPIGQGYNDQTYQQPDVNISAYDEGPAPDHPTTQIDVQRDTIEYRSVSLERIPPPDPFDKRLAAESRVTVVGGDAGQKDATVFQIVATHAEQMQTQRRPGVVVTVDFAPPSADGSHLEKSAPQGLYTVIDSHVADNKGVFAVLDGDQISEALATAAGGDNIPRVSAFDDVLRPIIKALERPVTDPETGQRTIEQPTLVEVRDAVRHLRDMRPIVDESRSGLDLLGEAAPKGEVSLTAPQREAVENSIPVSIRAEGRPTYEALGAWLDKAVRDPVPGTSGAVSPDGTSVSLAEQLAQSGIAVVRFGISPGAYGRQLAAESAMLANAMVPLIAQQTPWGKPELVVASNLDKAGPVAAQELVQVCEEQGIRLVATLSSLNQASVPLATRSAYAVLPCDPVQANILSNVLGTTMRQDVTSISQGVSGTIGSAEHQGQTVNYKKGQDFAEGDGTSASQDISRGVSFSFNETVAVTEGPRFRPAELTSIAGGEVVVIDSLGESHGKFSITNRDRIGDFPPAIAAPRLDVEAIISKIQTAQAAAAVAMGSPNLAIAADTDAPAAITSGEPTVAPRTGQMQQPDRSTESGYSPKQSWQVQRELEMRYSAEHRGARASGKGFERWRAVRVDYEERAAAAKQQGKAFVNWETFRDRAFGN